MEKLISNYNNRIGLIYNENTNRNRVYMRLNVNGNMIIGLTKFDLTNYKGAIDITNII